jgi:hypothetical protein
MNTTDKARSLEVLEKVHPSRVSLARTYLSSPKYRQFSAADILEACNSAAKYGGGKEIPPSSNASKQTLVEHGAMLAGELLGKDPGKVPVFYPNEESVSSSKRDDQLYDAGAKAAKFLLANRDKYV